MPWPPAPSSDKRIRSCSLGRRGSGRATPRRGPRCAVPPRRLRSKRYLNSALLVIDEVGFRPLDREEANLFFRLVSARYEKRSIILTSNKHVRDCLEIFWNDEILTNAILDRLLHHVHIIHIDGRSYRLRELDGLLAQQPDRSHPKKGGGKTTP